MEERILIVEDELSIVTLLTYNLQSEGYQTEEVFDGKEAIQKIKEQAYDLIILDIMLPKFDGLEICKYIRSKDKYTPILMVTALNDDEHIIEGLDSGADDYITKPFSPKVLVARVKALLRRTKTKKDQEIETKRVNGDLTIYPHRYEALYKTDPLTLTKKEYELLNYFMINKGLVLSRDQLLEAVWDYDVAGDTRIVDVHVGRLRDKIEENRKHPIYIETVHGFGYKMNDMN